MPVGTSLVFFQDGPVYYAFDYQNGAMRLIDVEWINGSESGETPLTISSQQNVTEDITCDMRNWFPSTLQQIGRENPDTLEGLLEILQTPSTA